MDGSKFQNLILCLWIVCLLLLAFVAHLVEEDIQDQKRMEVDLIVPADSADR